MAYKELEYMDKCTIVDLDTEIVDSITGDVTKSVICENIPCDFQPTHTEQHNGVLVQFSPKLYLPYDFEYSDKLNPNLQVVISRWTIKNGAADINYPQDLEEKPAGKHLAFAKIEDYQEINIREKLVGIEIELREVTY